MQQFRRGEQAYIPPSLQTEVLNALFDDVLVPEPSESVGWVDEMLVVHEGEKEKEVVGKEKKGKGKKEKRGKEKSVGKLSHQGSERDVRNENGKDVRNEEDILNHDGRDILNHDDGRDILNNERAILNHDSEKDILNHEQGILNQPHAIDILTHPDAIPQDHMNTTLTQENEAIHHQENNNVILHPNNQPPTDHLNVPPAPSHSGQQRVSWLESMMAPASDVPRASLLQEPSGDLGFGLPGLLAPFPQHETKEPLGTPGLFSEQFGFLDNDLGLFGRKENPEQMAFFGQEEKGSIIDMLQGSSRDLENAPSLLQIARDNMDREEKERMKKVAEEKEKRRLEAIARAETKKSNADLPESTIKKVGLGLKPRSIMLRKRKWIVCFYATYYEHDLEYNYIIAIK